MASLGYDVVVCINSGPICDKSTNGFKDWTSRLDNDIGTDIIFLDF